MLQDLIEINLFSFFLIFARLGTAFSTMPGFASAYVSMRIRLSIALASSFLIMPVIGPDLPVMPKSLIALSLLIFGEVIIGSFIGMIARVFIGALQTAGTLIAYSSSMANAMINDPISEQQSSTTAGFLMTTGLILIFVSDLHHLMFQALVDSYTLFVPGFSFPAGDLSNFFANSVNGSFKLGLQLAFPFIIVGLTYNIGLGLLGRLMPALPVFFFGIPGQLALQFWIFTITFSGIMLTFLKHFQNSYTSFLSQ